jgi:low temperature requirement protein LtrA
MSDRTRHGVLAMRGRDPHEVHRAATPLELLFDLTFVIAFGVAADEFASAVAHDHVGDGILGFCFAAFAVSWAWINFAWFASAYDTDDWIFRLTTMVQMFGVLVLALGLPQMFASLEDGDHVDNSVMVLGYVIMRVPMLFQWVRAARQDPERRPVAEGFIATLAISQIAWVVLALSDTTVVVMFSWAIPLVLIELVGPYLAEQKRGGTPWHPHHIAERYGLLVIIALGEGLLGTTVALGAVIAPEGPGWSDELVLLGLAGTAMTFGMWWIYFVVPSGPLLHAHRERSFGWGYGHIPLFGATVAVGAGLHVAAYYIGHDTHLSAVATLATVAIPLAVYVLMVFVLYMQISRTYDPFHLILLALSAVVLGGSMLLAVAGVDVFWCLLLLAATPWVTVVGYETIGHRHNQDVLDSLVE